MDGKSATVSISQPMYFPWVGMLQQIGMSDIYVFYEDVQFSKGSFTNRVQIKTKDESRWLTVPLRDHHLGQLIDEVKLDDRQNWQSKHISILKQSYSEAPYCADMIALVDSVFSQKNETLSDLSKASTIALAEYLDLADGCNFVSSSGIAEKEKSTARVLGLCRHFEARNYLTAHGAADYLDHELFEQQGINVYYIDYQLIEYDQLHNDFTPYVSALDIVANIGQQSSHLLSGQKTPWKDFLNTRKA